MYKVVTKDRKSYLKYHILRYGPLEKKLFITSRYILSYPEGETVRAPENTLGIMVFKNRDAAERFIQYDGHDNLMIIKIKPVGKEKQIKSIPVIDINTFELFYSQESDFMQPLSFQSVPEGTVCYPAVEVLE